ncbi:MAG: hypothetical protein OEV45_06695 [Desulfobacteraceae bacterium]|nr:hypothetical protein [Desulfobacteraceae bacterium]
MKDEFLTLFETAKALVSYIDKEYVFDKAAAGGCSGMDYHLSDKFYDLIVDTKKAINEVENGLNASDTDSENDITTKEGCLRLFEAVKDLTTHVEKERAFDKVNDMGPVGIETYQSDAFIEVIQRTNKAIQEAKNGLKVSE